MTTFLMRMNQHDERALHALLAGRRRWLDLTMGALTHLGDALVIIPVLTLLLFLADGPVKDAASTAAWALIASHAAVQLLKRTLLRARPCMPMGVESLIEAPDRFSFPSGHAAASLCIALPMASVVAAPWSFALVIVGFIIGLSRCYLGVHYPGDVAAGWFLAIAALLLV
jgi:undecaprenyl-diphosphatase